MYDMASNTALSYQMMIEEKIMSAMINAEQRGQYSFACHYATAHLKFLGKETKDLPQIPLLLKTESEKQMANITQYFNLLDMITTTTSSKIAEVRQKYGKKSNEDLMT